MTVTLCLDTKTMLRGIGDENISIQVKWQSTVANLETHLLSLAKKMYIITSWLDMLVVS